MVTPVADARSEYFLWSGDAERARAEARRGLDFAGSEQRAAVIAGASPGGSGGPVATTRCRSSRRSRSG
jgi:hypothetical protein